MAPEKTIQTHDAASQLQRSGLKRFAPVLVLFIVAGAIYAFDLQMYLSFEALRENRTTLLTFVASNAGLAALLFTFAGAGIGAVFDSGEAFSVSAILSP